MYDLRRVGVSLWQHHPYEELELLVGEAILEPDSHIRRAVQEAPPIMDDEQQQATDETLSGYKELYGL